MLHIIGKEPPPQNLNIIHNHPPSLDKKTRASPCKQSVSSTFGLFLWKHTQKNTREPEKEEGVPSYFVVVVLILEIVTNEVCACVCMFKTFSL